MMPNEDRFTAPPLRPLRLRPLRQGTLTNRIDDPIGQQQQQPPFSSSESSNSSTLSPQQQTSSPPPLYSRFANRFSWKPDPTQQSESQKTNESLPYNPPVTQSNNSSTPSNTSSVASRVNEFAMKGIGKFVKRAPQMMGSKVGLSQKSHDAVFDDLNRRFTVIEKYSEKLQKDSSTFRDATKSMLMSGSGFCENFGNLFKPMGHEIDIERNHPEATNTIVNATYFQQSLDELRETLTPEVELIESRVLQPIQEFISVCKTIRKNITKRDHKLVDYDRHNNAYTKLRDKKEKSLKDEQNLFKVEQDYETAAADYEHYNNMMKEELPRFFEMATRFMTPLFHSFYYMQLNVFYLTLEKLQNFANGRYDISAESVARLESDYVAQLNDASERLEALTIRKPAMPTARILQQQSKGGPGSPTSSTIGSKAGIARSSSIASSAAAPPPTYSAQGSSSAAAAVGKRAPPPIPGKPASSTKPSIQYVIALYDYTAQADGDLSFKAGDRIEVVERTASTEDWWTGKLDNLQGVFPGNYVRDE